MTLAAILVLAAVLVAQVGPSVRARFTRTLLARRIHSKVIVTLQSGATFRGVLAETDAEAIVLRTAEALSAGTAAAVIVDGELIIQRADIAYLQRP